MDAQDVSYATSNIIHEYEFSWTIVDFSISPDVLRGPFVSRIPGFPDELCIELQFKETCNQTSGSPFTSSLTIVLTDLNVKDRNLTVSSCASLRNTKDGRLKEKTSPTTEFKASIQLLEYCYYSVSYISKLQLSQLINLLDDKLVVKCKLSLSGQDIISSISTLVQLKDKIETCEELSKDFKTTYESGASSDFTFLVGEERLLAHKIVLLSRSKVFAKMFDSDLSESNCNEVVIKDADSHAFNCFLKFIYTGMVEDKTTNTVLSLYSLAHKYQVKSLHRICSRILGGNLAIDSVCRSLMLSDLQGDNELKYVAMAFIRRNVFQIAGTNEWAKIVLSKPDLVKEVMFFMDSKTTMK